MEINGCSPVHERMKKRKASEELNELSQDLLERVLSHLPPSSFLRLRSVCKKWSFASASATFQIACSQIPFRDPWFLMVDRDLNRSVIFDTSEGNWKRLLHHAIFNQSIPSKQIAVASNDGLVCFRSSSGELAVCNPVTGARRELALPDSSHPLQAIAMSSFHKAPSFSSYKVVLVSGELPNLCFRTFSSNLNRWEEEVTLSQNAGDSSDTVISGGETVYFLSKSGEVVATNMVRSPSKEFSAVLAVEDGDEILYFLNNSGRVMSCNLSRKIFSQHPRLLPFYSEHSIDVVVCGGEMMVVVLSEFLDTASLRVWRFCKAGRSWMQAAAMPPAMSHELYGKKADINCDGRGDVILVCLNSAEFSRCVMCVVTANTWVELPECVVNGMVKEFVSAFSFEPRLEACV
ncbi:F-box only protein 13 [Platanthera guangdongensis]|uniref:F-box only protein 13 n=1 Tax=Platanthera guangdongensis TaxID=2320717 RepID=A0ABR2LHN8_9ASPA